MAVIIGSARIDERGKARGGKAGDQRSEVSTQAWYKHRKGWVLLRPKDADIAEKIARCMEMACANSCIGYDQGQRETLYATAKPHGFDCSKVKTKCETDCSALVRVCCAYAGITVGNFRTTNQASLLMQTGAFEKLTESKYTTQSAYLMRGDILVTKTQGHTVVVLTDGTKAGKRTYALGERLLQYGCTGSDVAALQTILKDRGYDLGKWGVDGDYGAKTRAAVLELQLALKVKATGVYEETTHAALFAADKPEIVPAPEPIVAEPEQNAYPVFGVCPDISKYQGNIDFDAFCAGADFAIFRARVNGKNDSKFKAWAAECVKRGFPFSVYDFVTLTDEADAVKQAEAFYKLTSPFNPRIYYLDVETLGKGVSHAENRAMLKAYVARLRELGAERIGLYMGDYRFRTQYKQIAEIFDTLWIANWGKQTGYLSAVPKSKCDLHQYTSMGYAIPKGAKKRVPGAPGIKHRIDLNRITGNKPLSFFTGREHVQPEYSGIVKATGADVNIRSGAGTQYKKLGEAEKGRPFERRPGDTAEWYAIRHLGKDAFISKKYAKEAQG